MPGKFHPTPRDVELSARAGRLNKMNVPIDGIEAAVQRTKGDTSPLEITIDVNACDDKNCLAPGKIKLMVP